MEINTDILLRPDTHLVAIRNRFLQTIDEFVHLETAGSIVLLVATISALILANSPLSDTYFAVLALDVNIQIGGWQFSESILHLIDDGLMAVFFFVVGLEIKREIIVGELSKPRQAILPIAAAVGGMAVPAVLYLAINGDRPGVNGWGVPMATDIAFALGVLAMLGSRIPAALKVFLTALAIADDLGAVMVIALFYTSGIHWEWLAVAGALLLILVLFNLMDMHHILPYLVVSLVIWYAMLESGVHATVAGVLVAAVIPARSTLPPIQFVARGRELLDHIERIDVPGSHVLDNDEQQVVAMALQRAADYMQAPLQRLEHALHPVSTFLILPIFALANAGVRLEAGFAEALAAPVSLGVILGLVVGKQAGIMGMCFAVVQSGIARLPKGVSWNHLYGASWLAGIGFTMSLFISNLAFGSGQLQAQAKLGILVASALAGTIGFAYLALTSQPVEEVALQPQTEVGPILVEEPLIEEAFEEDSSPALPA